jgi:putative ABC transport system ATP-binding protein
MSPSSAGDVIRTEGLTKVYGSGRSQVIALRGIDLTVRRGEMVAVMGASGSGKSTLMNILGCLDYPTAGSYRLDGERVEAMGRNQLADLRNRKIGFVFQGFHLLARTTALENVELPLLYDRSGERFSSRQRAAEALSQVGLGDRMDHEPNELSGGQQQRVAIARALVTRPAMLLADEPTGNLDSRTSVEVMALFQELNRQGLTAVVVTHEPDIARYTGRVIELRDGLVVHDEPVAEPRDAAADLSALPALPPPPAAGDGAEAAP